MNHRELARPTCLDNISAFGKATASIIGEWAAASHVERQSSRKATPDTAPVPKI